MVLLVEGEGEAGGVRRPANMLNLGVDWKPSYSPAAAVFKALQGKAIVIGAAAAAVIGRIDAHAGDTQLWMRQLGYCGQARPTQEQHPVFCGIN